MCEGNKDDAYSFFAGLPRKDWCEVRCCEGDTLAKGRIVVVDGKVTEIK